MTTRGQQGPSASLAPKPRVSSKGSKSPCKQVISPSPNTEIDVGSWARSARGQHRGAAPSGNSPEIPNSVLHLAREESPRARRLLCGACTPASPGSACRPTAAGPRGLGEVSWPGHPDRVMTSLHRLAFSGASWLQQGPLFTRPYTAMCAVVQLCQLGQACPGLPPIGLLAA